MKRKESNAARSVIPPRVFALVSALVSAAPEYVAAAPPTPGAQYGYSYARTADEKKVYGSALFEMPMEGIRADSGVINAEFTKVLVQRYGAPASPGADHLYGRAPARYGAHRRRLDLRAHRTDPAAGPPRRR